MPQSEDQPLAADDAEKDPSGLDIKRAAESLPK
jgi:hypothetical protein